MTGSLARAGVEVKILTTDYHQNGNPLELACETKIFPCKFGPWQWAPALGKALRTEVPWADVVNIHTLWTYPVTAAARACVKAGVPYILRPAGMLDPWSLSQKRFKKKLYRLLVERETINGAAALWFTSEEERAGARHSNYETSDFVIPLGVALEEFLHLPAENSFRKRFLNSNSKRIVLFMGRLTPKKQPELLLRAFADIAAQFDDTILVIAGPAQAGYLAHLETLAGNQGIQNRVYFTGCLKKGDVVSALSEAEVFVLPSLDENFGVAVIEAMAAGTPVVIGTGVGLASVVKDASAGMVIRPNLEELKSSLSWILSNRAAANEMGKHGREVALKNFSWDRIVPSLTDAYRAAIEGMQPASLVRA